MNQIEAEATYHVESLEDLPLVTCTVTVEGKSGRILVEVLHGEGDTGADGHLCTDDTVTTEEGGGEHVHGPALAVGHASLAT